MHRAITPLALITILCAALIRAATASAADSSSSTLTIYAWPLSSPSPSPLAAIALSRKDSSDAEVSTPSAVLVKSFQVPPSSEAGDEDQVVRVGLYDPASKAWSGTATSRQSFEPGASQRIVLRTDERGHVFHVGFSAKAAAAVAAVDDDDAKKLTKKERVAAAKEKRSARQKAKQAVPGEKKNGTKEKEQLLQIEVIPPRQAAMPVLNKPVVLNLDGKVEEKVEDNRSFLQKYWWAILLFIVINIIGSVGPEEGK